MRASIAIACRNEGSRLARTVESCLPALEKRDCEIVVADDASTDASLAELRRLLAPGAGSRVTILESSERSGVSPTKDRAARHSKGDALVFLDAHTLPEPGSIETLLCDLENLHEDAVVTPAVPALDVERWECKPHQIGHGYRMTLDTFNCAWIGLDTLKPHGEFYESPALIGCCVAMKRDVYEKLQGFDRDMQEWGVEDIDFGLKAWLLGIPVLHDPRARVAHRFRATFDNFSVSMEHVLVNQLRMARKNYSEDVWLQWTELCRSRISDDLWKLTWNIFQERRESAEREREYLAARRVHDEYWYACKFGLSWPESRQGRKGGGLGLGPGDGDGDGSG